MPLKFGKREYIYTFLVVFLSLFLLVILFISLIPLFLLHRERYNQSKQNLYQLIEINPSKNRSSFGYTRIDIELTKEEYISYYNQESGSISVLSNIFDNEFECSGYCYCEKDSRRGSSISHLNGGLFLILSAISATMAISIAKEAFSKECEKKYLGICERSIIVELDVCNEVIEVTESDMDEKEKIDLQKRLYSCVGYCVHNQRNLVNPSAAEDLDEYREGQNLEEARKGFGDCERLEKEGKVEIIVPFTKKEVSRSNRNAQVKFRKEYLTSFCKSQSYVNAKVKSRNGKSDSSEYFLRKKKDGASTSLYLKETKTSACNSGNINTSNVKCKLIRNEIL